MSQRSAFIFTRRPDYQTLYLTYFIYDNMSTYLTTLYPQYELDKLDVINRETLEVVVQHLSKVAKADNKMDIDNIALLFGQVLLWPDNEVPMDFGMLAGEGALVGLWGRSTTIKYLQRPPRM